jgi:flavin-dependent dehydrogenase
MRSDTCDVLVVGGGPAGSTAGNLLAAEGRRVILLERDSFPRFHIGESLIPYTMRLFERLGVLEDVARIGSVEKYGVRFVTGDGAHSNTIYFDRTFEPSPVMTYQVVRSEFDTVLLERCAERGADVRQRHAAVSAERRDGEWRVRVRDLGAGDVGARGSGGAEYEIASRYLVDASGRDTFLAQSKRSKRMAEGHRRVAIYAHFEGVVLDPGIDAGNTVIVAVEGGWFWVIPLARGTSSIGLVMNGERYRASGLEPEVALGHAMRACPEIARRTTASRRLSQVYATSNYSYFTDAPTGDGYVVAGDAYAFLDPIFSTGVWLAMQGGESAARVVGECLDRPADAARLLARHARRLRASNSRFWRFVDYFYRPEFLEIFMRPSDRFDLRAAVASVLAGTPSESLGLRVRLAMFFAVVQMQRWVSLRPPLPRCSVLPDTRVAAPAAGV